MDSDGGYKKTGDLGGARHGDAYQVHVLMLLSERAGSDGYRRYADFRLAMEIEAAGVFDDAVLSWQNVKSSWNWLFVQVKHKKKPLNLEERHLFPEDRQDDFAIYKYLEAFWNIKHGGEFVGNKQFILFTNCGLAACVQDWFTDGRNEIESILTLETKGEQFMKLIPTEERCQKLFAVNSDFNKLTEIIRSAVIDGKEVEKSSLDLLEYYRPAIVNKILVAEKDSVRFAPRFIKNKKLLYAEQVLRGKLFQEDATLEQLTSYCVPNTDLYKRLKSTSKKKSSHTLPVLVEKEEMEEFLNSLIFAVNQPDNVYLNMAITNDLKSRHKPSVQGPNTGDNYASLAYCKLQRKIYECLDAKNGVAIRKPQLEQIFQDVEKTMESPIMNFPTILFREKMLNYRVTFNDPIPPIPEMYPAAILTSNSLLTCLKVFQNVPEESFYYFTLKDIESKFIRKKLCEALREQKTKFYLLIKDDQCPQFEFASEILEAVTSGSSIKLILLTDCDESASYFFNERTYTPVQEEDITLDQLTVSSQGILMEKAVLFQGSDLQLSKLADDTILGQVVKNETLEKLLLDETVTIGPTLPELGVKQYISRTITSTPTLLGQSTYDEEQFLDLNPAALRKVVVLSSSAGMGKTTLWKKLARLTKSRFQTEWVFYLKLHECEEHFNNSTNLDVADFLIKLFQLPQLDAVLLRRKLEDHERVYVFCDGFDELPVEFMESAIDMIRMLQESTQVLMNTRTSLLMKLQEAFDVVAFYLESISPYDQTFLFKCLCDISDADVNSTLSKFVDQLMINILNKTFQQSAIDYLGVPMMVTMFAEIYKPNIQEYQKTKDPKELEIDWDDLNIVQLFEKYVYSYFRRHTNLSIANRNTQLMFDPNNYLYRGFVKLHCYLGLKILAQDQKIIRDKQELQELEEQFHLLDSPIVDHVSRQSTKPIFIHLSIAEFFAAKCLFQYLSRVKTAQLNGNFLKINGKRMSRKKRHLKYMIDQYYQILRDHPVVRSFFLFFAQYHKDCLPKCELVLWCMRHNTEIVLWAFEGNFEELAKRLLQEAPNVNVNIEGKNRETLLHMAAGKGWCEVARLLIARGATVDAITYQNNTPLHHAAMSGHLDVVELLAEKGCDLNKLNSMKINALHCAAVNKHTDVVRFLGEMGVKPNDGLFRIMFDPPTNSAMSRFRPIYSLLLRDKKYDELTNLLWLFNNEIGQGIARDLPQFFEILPIFRKRTL